MTFPGSQRRDVTPGPQHGYLRERLLCAGPWGQVHQALLSLLPLRPKSSPLSNSSPCGIVPLASKGLGGNPVPACLPGRLCEHMPSTIISPSPHPVSSLPWARACISKVRKYMCEGPFSDLASDQRDDLGKGPRTPGWRRYFDGSTCSSKPKKEIPCLQEKCPPPTLMQLQETLSKSQTKVLRRALAPPPPR